MSFCQENQDEILTSYFYKTGAKKKGYTGCRTKNRYQSSVKNNKKQRKKINEKSELFK